MANTLNLGNGDWATKENSLLGYNSESGNYKPLPFDFTRASSATVVNKAGLIETAANGVPRIDFLGNTKGALKLEPQRTNRIPNSEDGSTWALNNITLSSLSGGLNKNYYQITSLGNTGRFDVVRNNWVNLTAGTYTASVFAKKGTCDEIILTTRANFSSQSAYGVFNLTSGTVVSDNGVVGSIEPYSDGWYRCAITFTNSGSYTDFASFAFGFNFNSSSTDTLFVASPQSEIGSYATSYIPTQGSAVTRVVDSCSQTVPDGIIGQTEGVVYIDFLSVNNFDGNGGNLFEIKEDNNNRISIYFSNGTPRLFGIEDASGVFNQALSLTTGSVCKLAIKYNSTSTKVFINGSLSHTLNGINNIAFSDYSFLPNNNIDYNEIKLYNTALTDAELIALTS